MINTTECKSRKPPTAPQYPRLMECTTLEGHFIVLFSRPNQGVVVSSQNPCHPVGTYGYGWATLFEDFHGSVELENAT